MGTAVYGHGYLLADATAPVEESLYR